MLDRFSQMSGGLKALSASIFGVAVTTALFAFRPPAQVTLTILIGLVVIGLVLLGYFFVLKGLGRKKSDMFSKSLQANATGEMKEKFQEGMTRFRQAGKDVYSLPWFLLVGETGSGKTEAIRHSQLRFPDGLANSLKGAGGTKDMDWWFSNEGVILDTAGRMFISDNADDSESGQRVENLQWEEFLKLAKRYRKSCPINGLLLVLPADKLIKDSAAELQRKGQQIAYQFELLQRTLDIRFPVYVIITKCDLVSGFREFFQHIDDPILQHQMMGWTNPDGLDVKFDSGQLDEHFKTLFSSLSKRRNAILAEKMNSTHSPDTLPLDEMDTLFRFPQNLNRMMPRLQRYFETIFSTNDWAPNPLFLRGVYLSSSMQEGAALEAELAEALGVNENDISSPTWKKDKALFLRDVFADKVFKERGLVTREANVNQHYRTRKIAVMATCAAAVLALFGLTFYWKHQLDTSIGKQVKKWGVATHLTGARTEGKLMPMLSLLHNDANYRNFNYNHMLVSADRKKQISEYDGSVCTLLLELHDFAKEDIRLPLIFRAASIGEDVNKSRRMAMSKIYKTSALLPVVEFSAKKLSMLPNHNAWDESAFNTWLQLVQLRQANLDNLRNNDAFARISSKQDFRFDLVSAVSFLAADQPEIWSEFEQDGCARLQKLTADYYQSEKDLLADADVKLIEAIDAAIIQGLRRSTVDFIEKEAPMLIKYINGWQEQENVLFAFAEPIRKKYTNSSGSGTSRTFMTGTVPVAEAKSVITRWGQEYEKLKELQSNIEKELDREIAEGDSISKAYETYVATNCEQIKSKLIYKLGLGKHVLARTESHKFSSEQEVYLRKVLDEIEGTKGVLTAFREKQLKHDTVIEDYRNSWQVYQTINGQLANSSRKVTKEELELHKNKDAYKNLVSVMETLIEGQTAYSENLALLDSFKQKLKEFEELEGEKEGLIADIPFTDLEEEQKVPTKFTPRRMTPLIESWKQFKAGFSGNLERSIELVKQKEQFDALTEKMTGLTDGYFDYWREVYNQGRFKVGGGRNLDWEKLHKDYGELPSSYNLISNLKRYFGLLHEVFGPLEGMAECRKSAEVTDIVSKVKLTVAILQDNGLNSRKRKVYEYWDDQLNSKVTDVIDNILSMTEREFLEDCNVSPSGGEDTLQRQYWEGFVETFVAALAKSAKTEFSNRVQELDEFRRFPLAQPGEGQTALSQQECHHALDVVRKTEPLPDQYQPGTIGQVPRLSRCPGNLREHLSVLKRPGRSIKTGGKWFSQLNEMLELLIVGKIRQGCRLEFDPELNENSRELQTKWTAMSINKTGFRVRGNRSDSTCTIPMPRAKAKLHLEFFASNDDYARKIAGLELQLTSEWTPLLFLFNGPQLPSNGSGVTWQAARPAPTGDGTSWILPLRFSDPSQKGRLLNLRLTYPLDMSGYQKWIDQLPFSEVSKYD